MPLPDPNLDDRSFEQILSEAKRRIPNYTTEWTDLNESDPGMALVQLFVWLSEMIIHRLNKVPAKSYLKFLELLGITLNPAVPAQADLAFTLTTSSPPTDDGFVEIPQGTKVSLSDAVPGGPVTFETDENLYAVGPALKYVRSFDGALYTLIDETNRGPGQTFLPFGEEMPRKDSALHLGFDGALPQSTTREITLAIYVFSEQLATGRAGLQAAPLTGRPVDEDEPDLFNKDVATAGVPPVIVAWEFLADDGSADGEWRAVVDIKDTTEHLTRTGKVRFKMPGAMKSRPLKTDEKTAVYWVRNRIAEIIGGGYQTVPQLEDVAVNVIGATNSNTVTDELLGASDASANQSFQLAHQPVLRDSLEVAVFDDEAKSFVAWKRVNDFGAATRTDKVYTLDATTGTIAFGDGVRGMIPPRLPAGTDENTQEKDRPNIVASRYRWGGGARGNGGAGKVTSIESPLPFVKSVRNPRPAEGGRDEETLEEAKRRAPETIRTRSRAVTGGDFEVLARQTPGARIKRARALPLHHPEIQQPSSSNSTKTNLFIPGVVTVVVVPEAGPNEPKPMPTEETLARVGRWLNQHRLITTELYVAAPKYRRVAVEVTVFVKRTANIRQVEERLQQELRNYFHPLTGGDGNGWEFGGTIVFSKTFSRILNTDGVEAVESASVKTRLDGEPHPPCTDIELAPDEIVFSTEHFLTLSYA